MTPIEELKTLYPSLSPEELAAAKEKLDRYLLLAWEIVEDYRLGHTSDAFSRQPPDGTIKGKVDSPTN